MKRLVLTLNEIGNLYQMQVWNGFRRRCYEFGVQPVAVVGKTIDSPIENEALHNRVFLEISELGAEGMLVFGGLLGNFAGTEGVRAFFDSIEIPSIWYGCHHDKKPNVTLDARAAMRSGLEHLLLDHGRSNLVCITGSRAHPENEERLQTFRSTLAEIGYPWDTAREMSGDYVWEGGEAAMEKLLEKFPNLDAVFCFSDAMAFGAMYSLRKEGRRISSEVSVMGFDDMEEAQFSVPSLSTIRQPTESMTALGVDYLLQWIEEGVIPRNVQSSAELVNRASCGCKNLNNTGKLILEQYEIRRQFYSRQKVRHLQRASQTLFSSMNPDTWPSRLSSVLRQADIYWMRIITDKVYEYSEGELVIREKRPNQDLSDLPDYPDGLLVYPLVADDCALGTAIVAYQEEMDDHYESLFLQLSIAWRSTLIFATEKETQQKLAVANQELSNLSLHDELTGLYNRRGFTIMAEQSLSHADRRAHLPMVAYIDLDDLKGINDHYGHFEGDWAIQKLGQVLSRSLRRGDVLGRIGGDEFVIFGYFQNRDDSEVFVSRLRSNLKEYNLLKEREYTLGMSLGVFCPEQKEEYTLQQMMQKADALLYKEKKDKKISRRH